MAHKRTALLLRCSTEEAGAIREAAKRERRTISGFLLNAAMSRITNQRKLEAKWEEAGIGKRKARAASEPLD